MKGDLAFYDICIKSETYVKKYNEQWPLNLSLL